MRSPNKFSPEYFLKYKENPVKLKPFSRDQENIGKLYLKKVKNILIDFNLKVAVRGSTAFKILGKGDVEIGVYPSLADWPKVIKILEENFSKPENLEKDYVRFNSLYKNTEVEIIVLKGREGKVDQKLHEYLLGHPDLLKRYEMLKKKYAYSKREYNFRKNEFLRRVEELIPED